MKTKKQVVFTLALVVMAMMALSVNIALASSGINDPGSPTDNHPPECVRIESFAPGVVGLQCSDAGRDIVSVDVKANVKYELKWNAEAVLLYVYIDAFDPHANWVVKDKAGNVTAGHLP